MRAEPTRAQMLQQAKVAFHFLCSHVIALVLAAAFAPNTVRA